MTLEPSAVAAIVTSHGKGQVTHVDVEQLVAPDWGRSTVWRCRSALSDGGTISVIVKQSNLGGAHGANEAACLSWLSRFDELQGRVPRLIGRDTEGGLLVLEDLGELRGRRIADIWHGGDLEQTRKSLRELLRLAGLINALTLGPAIPRGSLAQAGSDPEHTGHAGWRLPALARTLPEAFESIGCETGTDLRAEVGRMASLLERPGEFEGLVHGDICPSNAAWSGPHLVLYDFEMAAPRLATVDGAWARMRCLRCFNGLLLGDGLRRELEDIWLNEAAAACPALREAEVFNPLMSAAVVGWLGAMLEWLPEVIDGDRQRDRLSDRPRVLAALDAAVQCHAELGCLPRLAAACAQVREALARRWPEAAEVLAQAVRL